MQCNPIPPSININKQTLLHTYIHNQSIKIIKMAKILNCLLMVMVCCMMFGGGGVEAADQSLAEQCSSKLPEVMTCVAFASGKESSPQQKCCDSVEGMKQSNPACLCFLIQQIHNGTNPALQKMNIQEARLLQLPSACKIANASISDCPKLLKLPPNSPDAAIFTNASNSTVSTPATGGGGSTSTSASHHEAEAATLLRSIMIIIVSLVFLISA